MKLAFLVVSLLAACSAPAVARERVPVADGLGLPPVRGPLVFPPGATEVTLGWLVDELARLTGQELALSPGLRAELEQTMEPLERTDPVPAREVYSFVEALLARAVLLAPSTGGERPVLALAGWNERTPSAGQLPKPVAIGVEDMAALDEHPALYFQLTLTFQNVDSRQLQTQLRQLLVDNRGFNVTVPAGDRSLLMQGSGAKLASLARTLLEVDRAAAAPRPAAPATASPSLPSAPAPAPPASPR